MKYLSWLINKVWDEGTCPKLGSKVRNEDGRPGTNDFFSDQGIVGILDSKDMKNQDNISPFMGAIVNQECGEREDDPVKI